MTRRRAWEIFIALAVLALIVLGLVESLEDHYARAAFDISLAILLIVQRIFIQGIERDGR